MSHPSPHWLTRSLLLLLATTGLTYGIGRIALPTLSSIAVAQSSTSTFPDPLMDIPATKVVGEQTVVLAGGCFWGVEAVFEHLKGVSDAVSGYSGGSAATAGYERVSTGTTGHAESVKITYNPAEISLGQILKVYFAVAHDPTELNRQGPDEGTQYRSAIFYADEQQQQVAEAYIAQLNQAKVFGRVIATQVVPLTQFYPAEDYHQNFIDHNPDYPYVVVNDLPKLEQLQRQFPALYRS